MQIGSPRSGNVRCSISCFLLRNPRNCQERSGFGHRGYDANLGTGNYGNSVGMRFNERPPADEWAWQNRMLYPNGVPVNRVACRIALSSRVTVVYSSHARATDQNCSRRPLVFGG